MSEEGKGVGTQRVQDEPCLPHPCFKVRGFLIPFLSHSIIHFHSGPEILALAGMCALRDYGESLVL